MDAARSLPTPEMSPPDNITEKEQHYLYLYGHQNGNRFNQSINVQQQTTNLNNSNNQTGSSLYQITNSNQQQAARHSPGALSTSSSVCSTTTTTNNNSTNNSSIYSLTSSDQQQQQNSTTNRSNNNNNDNPVIELISKFSPNSSTFLKNVCPPFRSTPQTSPTSSSYEQQQHQQQQLTLHQARYGHPVMDQSQMYSAKRTAYAYPHTENGQITWSVYEQPQQAYSLKPNENYGSDQTLIATNNNNEIYADYYADHQQQYVTQEQMMNPNDYLHTVHLLQAEQHASSLQQHQLQTSGLQSQQITMMQQYGREDSSFINALTEAQETISS